VNALPDEPDDKTWKAVDSPPRGGAPAPTPSGSSGEVPAVGSDDAWDRVPGPEAGRASSSNWFDPEPVILERGRVLQGKYQLIEEIGQGGMGVVWLVHHIELDERRALKVISPHYAQHSTARQRFRREARLMAKLRHPNAVAVHDHVCAQHLAYIEMEFVPGKTLKDILEPGRPMPLEWVAEVLDQLCSVLQAAHDFRDQDGKAHSIIHRDLKPSNLMLVHGLPPGENLKVLDFGIAKLKEGEGVTAGTTEGFIGTLGYCSPEQLLNRAVDGRSDIYSVGVMLYQFLTGSLPFSLDKGMLVAAQHIRERPPAMSDVNPTANVPRAVEDVVQKCLAKKPEDRPQTARELRDMFRKALPVAQRVHQPRARYGSVVAAGLAVCILIGGAAFVLTRGTQPKPPRPSPLPAKPESIAQAPKAQPAPTKVAQPTTPAPAPRLPAGYEAKDRNDVSPEGPARLVRQRDRVEFHRIRPGVYLPVGFEPSPDSLDDRLGEWPRVIVRRAGNVRVNYIRLEGKAFSRGRFGQFAASEDVCPPTPVTVPGFYIQDTEVTNAEVEEYLTRGSSKDLFGSWGRYCDELKDKEKVSPEELGRFPAACLSHKAAAQFAAHIGARLPSEDEWEFAARSRGQEIRWSWGNTDKDASRNACLYSSNRVYPAPVKLFDSDRTDQYLFDMTGNVQEWCREVYRPCAERTDAEPASAAGDAGAQYYVVKGGSFNSDPDQAMSFMRTSMAGSEERADIGFRIVVECPPEFTPAP